MSCVECGAPTALSVYRCSNHRRAAFYPGRVSAEQAARRTPSAAAFPGDPPPRRPSASLGAPTLRDRLLAELERRGAVGATASELTAATGADRTNVHASLTRAWLCGQVRKDAGTPITPSRFWFVRGAA